MLLLLFSVVFQYIEGWIVAPGTSPVPVKWGAERSHSSVNGDRVAGPAQQGCVPGRRWLYRWGSVPEDWGQGLWLLAHWPRA